MRIVSSTKNGLGYQSKSSPDQDVAKAKTYPSNDCGIRGELQHGGEAVRAAVVVSVFLIREEVELVRW